MYEKKQKKVSEYGLNQINKRVLLLVPKLTIVGEGIPTLMTSLGYSCGITSEGNPQNVLPLVTYTKNMTNACAHMWTHI